MFQANGFCPSVHKLELLQFPFFNKHIGRTSSLFGSKVENVLRPAVSQGSTPDERTFWGDFSIYVKLSIYLLHTPTGVFNYLC